MFSIIAILFGCTKTYTGPVSSGVTSLNIVNAIPGSSSVIANVNGQLPYYKSQISIGSGGYLPYQFSGGNTIISFVQTTDTTTPLVSMPATTLDNGTIHSLFLTGTISSPETMLVTDNLIHYGGKDMTSDSTTGIRFVNLSPGGSPISINIQGQSNGSEIGGLAYKQITDFKAYDAMSTVSKYTFEFRDASSGSLLATYELDGVNNGSNGNTSKNNVRFRNLTIIFQGLPGSESAFVMNDF